MEERGAAQRTLMNANEEDAWRLFIAVITGLQISVVQPQGPMLLLITHTHTHANRK